MRINRNLRTSEPLHSHSTHTGPSKSLRGLIRSLQTSTSAREKIQRLQRQEVAADAGDVWRDLSSSFPSVQQIPLNWVKLCRAFSVCCDDNQTLYSSTNLRYCQYLYCQVLTEKILYFYFITFILLSCNHFTNCDFCNKKTHEEFI